MPTPREAHRLLDEVEGQIGYALWRGLTDATLWAECSEVGHLFWSYRAPVTTDNPDLIGALTALARVASTEPVERGALAQAAAHVWDWAERRELKETALLFAELAARIEPENPERASTAGRLCRPVKEPSRGARWYLRAARLARFAGRDADFAIAHLGWGNMESELGRLSEAEFHATKAFRAALRVGRHGLAASAYHDLMTLRIHLEDLDLAWQYAQNAVALYKVDHPRFPALAHDIAFLWSKQRMFSSALPLYLGVLPTMKSRRERYVVLANIARAAAASHDRLLYLRASREILDSLGEGADVPPTACYHLACACQTYEEWAQAEMLSARTRANVSGRWIAVAEQLVQSIHRREAGDYDVLPPEGGDVDGIRETLLRRLKKHGAVGADQVPPERYPIT